MKMNKIGFVILGFVALCLLLLSFSRIGASKVAFVDNAQLFQGYAGKLEKETLIKTSENKYQFLMDSLEMELKAFDGLEVQNNKKLEQAYRDKLTYYNNVKNELYYTLEEEREKHSDAIWKQINQYVKDFGEKNDYEMILGALGNGSLMYAKEQVDITEEVLDYINGRYQGYE